MNINSVLNTTALAGAKVNAKVLKEGSSVLVRILSDKGGGKFEGSVAGVRVNLTSQRSLKPGEVFTATVTAKNGTIFISPKNNENILVQSQSPLEVISGAQVYSYLAELGLPPDEISLGLFQLMKQLGMKFSPELLRRLHAAALKFPGREKKAAQLLELMAQKGLSADDEQVLSLLEELETSDCEDKPYEFKNLLFEEKLSAADIKYFFEKLLSSSGENPQGLLTVMNHLGGKKGGVDNGSWILLPFEIVKNSIEEKVIGNGNMRLFIDFEKKLKNLNLFVNIFEKNFLFYINFENNICREIKINAQGGEASVFYKALKKELNARLPFARVEWSSEEEIEDFGVGLEEILVLGGNV